MENNFFSTSGFNLSIGDRIAKGGEGEVFEVLNNNNVVFKSYHKDLRTNERMEKLKYMCSNIPRGISNEKFLICWPQDIVYEDGEFAGFLMPRAFKESISSYHLCQIKIPVKFSVYWEYTYNRSTHKGRINRLMLSTNIAAAIQRIISSGEYVISDLKPQNLLITKDGKVSVIDMDSVQITRNNVILFRAPVSTPEYTPPEAKTILNQGRSIGENWDSFSLGILIYEILCGIHPYTGTANSPYDQLSTIAEKIENNINYLNFDKSVFKVLPPPHKCFDLFSKELQDLFRRIFQDINNSINRPSIREIGSTLAKEVEYVQNLQDIEPKHEKIWDRDKPESTEKSNDTKLKELLPNASDSKVEGNAMSTTMNVFKLLLIFALMMIGAAGINYYSNSNRPVLQEVINSNKSYIENASNLYFFLMLGGEFTREELGDEEYFMEMLSDSQNVITLFENIISRGYSLEDFMTQEDFMDNINPQYFDNMQNLYNNLLIDDKYTNEELGKFSSFLDMLSDSQSVVNFHKELIKMGFSKEEIGAEQDFLYYINPRWSNN